MQLEKNFHQMDPIEFRTWVCEIIEKSNTPDQVRTEFQRIGYPYMLAIRFFETPCGTKMQELLLRCGFLIGPGDHMTCIMVWGPDGLLLEF